MSRSLIIRFLVGALLVIVSGTMLLTTVPTSHPTRSGLLLAIIMTAGSLVITSGILQLRLRGKYLPGPGELVKLGVSLTLVLACIGALIGSLLIKVTGADPSITWGIYPQTEADWYAFRTSMFICPLIVFPFFFAALRRGLQLKYS